MQLKLAWILGGSVLLCPVDEGVGVLPQVEKGATQSSEIFLTESRGQVSGHQENSLQLTFRFLLELFKISNAASDRLPSLWGDSHHLEPLCEVGKVQKLRSRRPESCLDGQLLTELLDQLPLQSSDFLLCELITSIVECAAQSFQMFTCDVDHVLHILTLLQGEPHLRS